VDQEQKIEIPSSSELWESGDLTFSIWFKPKNLTLNQYILCHYNWRFRIAADSLYFTVGRMNDAAGERTMLILLAHYLMMSGIMLWLYTTQMLSGGMVILNYI
jgi:hypothetical protein